MYVFSTRGNAHIRWETCNPRSFLDQPLFLEAASSGQVQTIKDLAVFLDGTDILSCPDDPCIESLLEINRNLYNVEDRPCIYYSADWYYVLEFSPQDEDVFIGILHPDAPDDEVIIPDLDMWSYASIKSML